MLTNFHTIWKERKTVSVWNSKNKVQKNFLKPDVDHSAFQGDLQ